MTRGGITLIMTMIIIILCATLDKCSIIDSSVAQTEVGIDYE